MLRDLSVEEIDAVLESIHYSKLRISESPNHAPETRQVALNRIAVLEEVEKKLRARRKSM